MHEPCSRIRFGNQLHSVTRSDGGAADRAGDSTRACRLG